MAQQHPARPEGGRWIDQAGIGAVHLHSLEALGGVAALFTGRAGGVSPRWGGGLNWSVTVGDHPDQVAENRRRSLALLGLPPGRAVMAGLVHGDRVVAVTAGPEGHYSDRFVLPPGGESKGPGGGDLHLVPGCDALITDLPGVALVATAADCVPVYLYDPVRRAVGVAHAGWRGTVAGIAGKTAQAMMAAYGCRPSDLRAAVGPSIGPCCYEVDDQVADPVRSFYGEAADWLLRPGRAAGRYWLDLWEANRRDLIRAGVSDVAVSGPCTACQVNRLFSHRAEGGQAGRGAALIALTRQGGGPSLPNGKGEGGMTPHEASPAPSKAL